MKKDKYYEIMSTMHEHTDFEILHPLWKKCFEYILKSFKCKFTKQAINSLFYDFNMENWHLTSPEHITGTKIELICNFVWECSYISDRTSYDRLFRTHWFFLRAFYDEINKIRYPSIYGDCLTD